jgi:hypothetical protein
VRAIIRRPAPGRLAGAVLAVGLATALPAGDALASREGFCPRPSAVAEQLRENRRDLAPTDLICRTPGEIRGLAARLGFEGHGKPDVGGQYRRFRDAVTGVERLRLDEGHIDRRTGRPYADPRAAVPHVHGYYPDGSPMRDPRTGNTHFPLR